MRRRGSLLRNPTALSLVATLAACLAMFLSIAVPLAAPNPAADDPLIAQSLAELLQDARTVVSNDQDLINNPELGDKGLTGKVVLDKTMQLYKSNTGVDPKTIDPKTRQGRLLRAMMESIVEVVDANQETINAKGMGFKGFIPAVFGRLVCEAFARNAGGEAEIKITAPPGFVRNRKARPDNWEEAIIKAKLLAPDWPRGDPYSAMARAEPMASRRATCSKPDDTEFVS